MKKNVKAVLAAWIKAMQDNGIPCTSPYDLENFLEDHGSHEAMFKAKLFPVPKEEE